MLRLTHFITLLAFALSLSCFSSILLAKEIPLYDQPNANAKSVGKIDLATGIIPIFTPKNSPWLKVADPKNGNVGWIKTSDMNSAGAPNTISFTQKIITDGSNPNSYQVIQIGQQQPGNDKEVADMLNKMRVQQEAVQLYLRKAGEDMMNAFKNLYPANMQQDKNNPTLVVPVVVIPEPKAVPAKPAAKLSKENVKQ